MKKVYIWLILSITLAAGCQRFDDSAIWDELRDHEERIERLESLCDRLNSNIEALQTVLSAIEQNDYVTDITKIMEDGVEIGYSITFAQSGTITIYHGADGADGTAPKIGIRKASDGEYYWTSDDEWLTDDQGEKIPASIQDSNDNYITPLFRVADDVWYISYDGGNTWEVIQSNSDSSDASDNVAIFPTITFDDYFIYFTFSDGTSIRLSNQNYEAPQFHTPSVCHKSKDEQIKILCFGSSWFLNTWWYTNKITDNLGIDAVIHGYYMGGSHFNEWIAFYNNELTPFAGSESTRSAYRYVSEGGANYTVTKRVAGGSFGDQEFRDAWYEDLTSEDWDLIVFQQGAHQSVLWKYWENCDELASIIKRHCNPRTLIGFNNTWTPSVTSSYISKDSNGLCTKTPEGQKLWQTYNFYNCQRLMNITGIEAVSPVGAMMYTLRKDTSINIDGDDLCYDGLHLNHGLPMFAAACVFYETFIAPFYGISIKECTWLPTSSDQRGPFNKSAFRPISEQQRDLIYKYVRLSLSNRFAFNEPEREIEDEEEIKGTLLELSNRTLNVTADHMGNYGSVNTARMSSASDTKATGILVKKGETITLKGLKSGNPTLRVDYLYATSAGPNESISGVWEKAVGVGNDGNPENYFPLNADGSSDIVSITNNYGSDYYFFFAFAALNKTDKLSVSNYTVTWTVTDDDADSWTEVRGTEVLNTMPQESGYVESGSGLVTEYKGYDWSEYDIKVTCRYGTNSLMYAGCFWGENDTYLGGFWKSTGTAKVFTDVILTDADLPAGVSWSDVKVISLASSTTASNGLRHSKLSVRAKK